MVSAKAPFINEWCAHVIVAPDNNNNNVFNKGTSKKLKTKFSNPSGGHTPLIWHVGAKAEWKNAQKKAKKNITSDIIKSNIP